MENYPNNPNNNFNNPQYPYQGYNTPNNTTQYNNRPYNAPSVIYQNTYNSNGSAPQYHYGNPMPPIIDEEYYREQQRRFQMRRKEEKDIKRTGNLLGISLLLCLGMVFVFSLVVLFGPDAFSMGANFSTDALINIFYSVLVVGFTYFAFSLIVKKVKNPTTKMREYKLAIKYNPPKNVKKAILLIIIAFGGCMVANYATAIILTFMQAFGFDSGYSSVQNPSTITDVITMFIATAVIPPLIEEYAMRGVVLSSLTKHSKALAILGSAYIFGIFHGNFTQIPFAFLCGLIFAYITIATNSIWPAVIVHALNNSLSCIDSVISMYFDTDISNAFYYISSFGGIILGAIALVIYLKLYKKEDSAIFKEKNTLLSTKEKFAKFVSSPAMIIATVAFFIQAVTTAVAAS